MIDSVNRNPSRAEIRRFALLLLLGMPVIGGVWTGLVWLANNVFTIWILITFSGVGLVVGCLSLLFSPVGRGAYIVWHTLGAILERMITFISTFIMYYLTIVPIGLIMRLFGRKPLPVQFDRNRKSYWKDCKEEPDLKRYFRQY